LAPKPIETFPTFLSLTTGLQKARKRPTVQVVGNLRPVTELSPRAEILSVRR
jgi:hypothetical protein